MPLRIRYRHIEDAALIKRAKTGFPIAALFVLTFSWLTGHALAIDTVRLDRLALSADVIVTGVVESGGSFDALFRVETRIAGTCPDFIELFNSNRHPWNTMYHSWRTGARYILLLTGANGRYCLLSPGAGVWRIENGRVALAVSDPPLRYNIDAGLLIESLTALRRQYDVDTGEPIDGETGELIDALIESVLSGAASDRHYASEMLGNLFSIVAIDDRRRAAAENALIVAASDRNPKLRQSAASALARYPSQRCADAASALLTDGVPTVAFSAAFGLIERGDTRYVEPIMRWYRSELETVRSLPPTHYRRERFVELDEALWRFLFERADKTVAKTMAFIASLKLETLDGRNLSENAAIILAISGFGEKQSLEMTAMLSNTTPSAIPGLISALLSDSISERSMAIQTIGLLCDRFPAVSDAFDELATLSLIDPSATVRYHAETLVDSIRPSHSPALVARLFALNDSDTMISRTQRLKALTLRSFGYDETAMPREMERAFDIAARWAESHPIYIGSEKRILDRIRRVVQTPSATNLSTSALSVQDLFLSRLENDTASLRDLWNASEQTAEWRSFDALYRGIRRTGGDSLPSAFLSETNVNVRSSLLWAMARTRTQPPFSLSDSGSLEQLDFILPGEERLWLLTAGAWTLTLDSDAYVAATDFRRAAALVSRRYNERTVFGSANPSRAAMVARMLPDETGRVRPHPFRSALIAYAATPEPNPFAPPASVNYSTLQARDFISAYPDIIGEDNLVNVLPTVSDSMLDSSAFIRAVARVWPRSRLAADLKGFSGWMDSEKRSAALRVLSRSRLAALPADVADDVIKSFINGSSRARWFAGDLIAQYGRSAVDAARRPTIATIARVDCQSTERLVAELMLELLAQFGEPRDVALILERIGWLSEPGARVWRGLGLFSVASIERIALDKYGTGVWRDQYHALQAFSSSARPSFDSQLIESWRDEAGRTEALAADAISRRGGDALRLLEPFLAGKDAAQKLRAIRCLGRTGSTAVLWRLTDSLTKESLEKAPDIANVAALRFAIAELIDSDDLPVVNADDSAQSLPQLLDSVRRLTRERPVIFPLGR